MDLKRFEYDNVLSLPQLYAALITIGHKSELKQIQQCKLCQNHTPYVEHNVLSQSKPIYTFQVKHDIKPNYMTTYL